MDNKKKWRWGMNRWFVLLFIILNIISVQFFVPVRPEITVAPEVISHGPLFTLPWIGDFYLTNSMVAMVIEDILIILAALAIRRATRSGKLVPTGFSGAMEAAVEMMYNLTESSAGKYAKKIFPWFASILIIVLVANFLKLIPGVESIGWMEEAPKGYAIQELGGGWANLLPTEQENGHIVVGFVRGLSTDLNFTAALALIAVIMTQVIGVQAQGLGYFGKFFNVRNLFSKPLFGAIDFAVGLLETISELAKILSFAFRLFGNMFAGTVLTVLIGVMLPVFMPSGILLFEVFIGAIQAFVFGMLTMTFMSQATQGHGGEAHE